MIQLPLHVCPTLLQCNSSSVKGQLDFSGIGKSSIKVRRLKSQSKDNIEAVMRTQEGGGHLKL